MGNHRQYKRKIYARNVIFTVQGIKYHGSSENFSASGMFIKTDESFSVGQAIVFTIQLANTKIQPKFHAEIIRVTDDGIGVKFMK